MSRLEAIEVNDINITCSTGKDITAVVPEELIVLDDAIVAFNIKCSACPPQQYSVRKGKLGPKLKHQIHIQCYNCPSGGNCTNGQIKAMTLKYVSQHVHMDTAVLKGSVKDTTVVEIEDMVRYADIANQISFKVFLLLPA